MTKDARKFVEEALSPELPPANPLRLKDWAGLAFDRNRYANFAPAEFWTSLFEVQRAANNNDVMEIISKEGGVQSSSKRLYATNFDDLKTYWTTNAQFLKDHYLVCEGGGWIVRLDQDVTLFAAEISFASAVVKTMGGFGIVMDIMTDDFGIGHQPDNAGLSAYLRRIAGPLRQIS